MKSLFKIIFFFLSFQLNYLIVAYLKKKYIVACEIVKGLNLKSRAPNPAAKAGTVHRSFDTTVN